MICVCGHHLLPWIVFSGQRGKLLNMFWMWTINWGSDHTHKVARSIKQSPSVKAVDSEFEVGRLAPQGTWGGQGSEGKAGPLKLPVVNESKSRCNERLAAASLRTCDEGPTFLATSEFPPQVPGGLAIFHSWGVSGLYNKSSHIPLSFSWLEFSFMISQDWVCGDQWRISVRPGALSPAPGNCLICLDTFFL